MKLEDIKLQLGDKITFDSGQVSYVKDEEDTNINIWNKKYIAKIEKTTYETIWERKEETTKDDIE